MSIRKSQAFAALRTQIITELQHQVEKELIPHFNAEVEDIRKEHQRLTSEGNPALADHTKRARIQDLKVRQQDFLGSLNEDLRDRLGKRVTEYGGKVVEKEVGEGKESRKVLEAVFDDGSTARMPKALWIDYNVFQRA
jgi:hypothetical protein